MGCINSINSRKITTGDVFRTRVVRLQPESSAIGRNGILELTKKELVFIPNGQMTFIVWQLQHLRRYGLNGDVFSFEAGRRCMSGPGIFTFRCHQNAERLYQLFQRYVNVVSVVTNEEPFATRNYEHPSHTLGRPDSNPHSNNYLEPAPNITIPAAITHRMQALQESFSSSPLSLLDSPDSVPSLSFANEMIHFSNSNSISHHHPSTPGGSASYVNVFQNNLYSEHPFRSSSQAQKFFGSASTDSTLQRRPIVKQASLDAPQECAPLPPPITPSVVAIEALCHNYANVETGLGKLKLLSGSNEKILDPSERCYENLVRMDLPLLLQPPPTRDDVNNFANDKEQLQQLQQQQQPQGQQSQPTTPSGVNYIVLDLDQPRSPTQSSPKTCFGSGLSIVTGERSESTSMDLQSPPLTAGLSTSVKETDEPQQQQQQQQHQQQQKSEASLGYSTIDFIKTCALIKSTANESDLDLDPEHDAEESRITRHSKCVRKAYSISE